jgi:hypothetical protein
MSENYSFNEKVAKAQISGIKKQKAKLRSCGTQCAEILPETMLRLRAAVCTYSLGTWSFVAVEIVAHDSAKI